MRVILCNSTWNVLKVGVPSRSALFYLGFVFNSKKLILWTYRKLLLLILKPWAYTSL